MIFNKEHKDLIGTAFLALSIAMLGYMLVSPLNQMIVHVDEYFTLSVLHFPITALPQVISYDVHPPFHYMLLKIVSDILTALGLQANKIFAFKIMSIIPYAIILVLSLTKIRKEYGYLTAGLFAFSMAVMSEFLPFYSVMRMYSWAMLFVILAFVFLRDVIDKNDKKSWVLLTVFSVLAAYTHYFAAIPIVCIYAAFFFYFLRDKEKIKYCVISALCGVIIYVPWILAFMNQVTSVGGGYWIPKITIKNIIGFLGYFVTSSRNLYTCMFAIAILVVLIVYSARQFRDIDEKDRFYMISGIIAYFGTIVIGTAVSIIFKPILVDRYLLPSASILWLVISIWAGKVEAKKEFLITFGLILLLLAAGLSQLGSDNEFWLKNNWNKEAFFDQVAQDNNSIVINHPNNRMFYMEYGNTTEMYLLNPPKQMYGYTLSELHDLFEFKEISKEDIPKLVQNNTDKNIYIIYKNTNFDKNIKTQPLIKTNTVSFLEVQ